MICSGWGPRLIWQSGQSDPGGTAGLAKQSSRHMLPQLNPNGPELSILGALPLAAGQRNRPSDAPLPPNNGAAGKALNLGKAAFLRRRSQCSLVWRASDIIPLLRALPTSTHLALPFLDLPPPLRTAAKSKPRGQIFASVPPPPIPSPRAVVSCLVPSRLQLPLLTPEKILRACLVCLLVRDKLALGRFSTCLPTSAGYPDLCPISLHTHTHTRTIASRRFESKLPAVAAPETRVATTPLN